MKSSELRESFLKFFEGKGHTRVKSSGLIPQDATLFFTNAGMVQFKGVFTGEEKLAFTRATTSQKCMRVSGKHNDLENVGFTLRHHTFFEMLGNFSFGDYFKKDAITYAWEYLTQVIKIPKDRLHVTVFREDDEAEKLWLANTDIAKERIYRFDEKDNFWSMGDTGPCGPCSEIYYDHGAGHGCGTASCKVGCDCDRFMEIWNLVFMQFNRQADGSMENLPKPSVDTGMGLERLACVVQGKHSNYDSDLFTDIFAAMGQLFGIKYGVSEAQNVAMRVIADHLRACTFLVGEGVTPSNEGRGYVLRRILRRAIRFGKKLGFNEPFFFKLVASVSDMMGAVYAELPQNQKFIEEVIRAEEQRFFATLEKGLNYIETAIASAKAQKQDVIAGKDAFALYDTFGFPVDLTCVIASENQMSVDMTAFENLMEAQRERARAAWKGSGESKVAAVYQTLINQGIKSEFCGYESDTCSGTILAIMRDGALCEQAQVGDKIEFICDRTPFYAESGGQVGDKGLARTKDALTQIEVLDTTKAGENLIVHHGVVRAGTINLKTSFELSVNAMARKSTMANHSATHLLHAALRQVLGDHVKQAGSLVDDKRLRFDFSHFSALKPEEINQIEILVNEKIRENLLIEKTVKSYDQAIKDGAMALFGEKYGDKVRVLKMGDFSTELCGGTHAARTGDIAYFKIISEASVAAGVRRIEAVSGVAAYQYSKKIEATLFSLARELKTAPEEIADRVQKMQQQMRKLEKDLSEAKSKALSGSGAKDYLADVQEIKGIKVLSVRQDIDDIKALRAFVDQLKNKLGSGIVLVASVAEAKVSLIVSVSKDLNDKYQAGNIARELAKIVGGSGGGRPDMAQAGGSDVSKVDAALAALPSLL